MHRIQRLLTFIMLLAMLAPAAIAETLKQSTARPVPILMVDSTDPSQGKTGLTPTVTLSKNGGAFAGLGGSVSEIGNGWYAVALDTTDTNTAGTLLIHAEASGAQHGDVKCEVWANVLGDDVTVSAFSEVALDLIDTITDYVDNLEIRLGTPIDLGSGAGVAENLEDIAALFPANFSLLGINASGHITRVTTVDSAGSDFNDENVPITRTWKLKHSRNDNEGLVGEDTKKLVVGTNPTFAVDFAADLSPNDRVETVSTPTIFSGTAGGVTFGTTGREDSQAKVRITGVTAGTYVIEFNVTYHSGGTQTARVRLVVIE